MMELALALCFADPLVTAVLIDPLANNTRAHRFYQRLGFQVVDRRQFGEDDCLVHCLKREDWACKRDRQHGDRQTGRSSNSKGA